MCIRDRGKDNIYSNNEVYSHKMKSYANTLYWNETLRSDSYKSKLDLKDIAAGSKVTFRPLDKFVPVELEECPKLLFDLMTLIGQ